MKLSHANATATASGIKTAASPSFAMSDLITQANEAPTLEQVNEALPELFYLDLRGQRFRLTRDTLLGLPESVVFSLSGGFNYAPGGLEPVPVAPSDRRPHVNSANDSFYQSPRDDNCEITHVDFNPDILNYVLDEYHRNADNLQPPLMHLSDFPDFHGFVEANSVINESPDSSVPELALEPQSLMDPEKTPRILVERPAIIVLKEDIEYYCINEKGNTDTPLEELNNNKLLVGEYLVNRRSIFRDLLSSAKSVFKPRNSLMSSESLESAATLDTPESHLQRMLCLAGLPEDAEWHIREREPRKTSIISMQLSTLRVPKEGDIEAIQAVQKLLLFWKKPARKCWWNETTVKLGDDQQPIKIHIRKVWTLELSFVGIED